MLQHPAPALDGGQSRLEAAAVIPQFPPHLGRRPSAPVPPPPGTRRVGNDRPRASIHPRVPRLVPHIDTGQVNIGTVRKDVKSGNRSGLTHRPDSLPFPSLSIPRPHSFASTFCNFFRTFSTTPPTPIYKSPHTAPICHTQSTQPPSPIPSIPPNPSPKQGHNTGLCE